MPDSHDGTDGRGGAALEETAPALIVSCDSHVGPRLVEDMRPYCPKKYLERYDAFVAKHQAEQEAMREMFAKSGGARGAAFTNHPNMATPGHYDPHVRLRDMDADGVAAEVLLPNTVPPFFPTSPNITISLPRTRDELEKRWAGVQAHNRWQIDFCLLAPDRRRGLIQIFPNDVELALEEIRWGAEHGCFGGVLIPPVSPGDPQVAPLFHTRYEPIWALCTELDLTVVQHAGAGSPEMPMDQPASNAVLITE
ncbi:MAG TPA: amidohydrolase family protein, partial [Acidimicrobiales bacterium]|nr:amidohydrolase family protein [Acidimicrobiales bacterium]